MIYHSFTLLSPMSAIVNVVWLSGVRPYIFLGIQLSSTFSSCDGIGRLHRNAIGFPPCCSTTRMPYLEAPVSTMKGSGYQQKDRKQSQNDKTEHEMEKTVQNQGQRPKMSKSESIQKNQQSNRSQN
ncbi:hypothetical protein Tco_0674691 [Tanacetum coccineum]